MHDRRRDDLELGFPLVAAPRARILYGNLTRRVGRVVRCGEECDVGKGEPDQTSPVT